MTRADEEKIFHDLLSLQQQAVKLKLKGQSSVLSGVVDYVMFDSFCFLDANGRQVVSVKDVMFLYPETKN